MWRGGGFSPVCVECGRPLGPGEALYDVHAPGNVELLKCVHCGQVRDRFVEYDAFLLLLDLLLLHPPAYRHCIFNHFGGPRGAQEKGPKPSVGATSFLLWACPTLVLTHACLSLSVATFRSREEWGSQGIRHFLQQPLYAHRHWLLALGGLLSGASLTCLSLLCLTPPRLPVGLPLNGEQGFAERGAEGEPGGVPASAGGAPLESKQGAASEKAPHSGNGATASSERAASGTAVASGKGAASERRAASGDAAASGKRVAAASTMDWTDAATRGGPSQLGAAGGQPAASLAALALVLGDAPKLLAFTMLVWPYPPVLIYALCCLAAASSFLSFSVLLSSNNNMGGAARFVAALVLALSRLAVELLGLTRVYRNSFWECRAQEL